MFNRIIHWSFLYDQEPFEIFSIVLKLIIGFSMGIGVSGNTTATMALFTLAPRLWWAAFLITVALTHSIAILRKQWGLRKISIMAAMIFWLFIFFIYLNVSRSGLVVIFAPTFALFLGWVYIRLSVLQQAYQRKKSNG